MYTKCKQRYCPPAVLQEVRVQLDRSVLIGSLVDFIYPVESLGQEKSDFVDYTFSEDTFNHTWGMGG